MKRTVRAARRLRGTIEPPGDKSISHRAAILNAIAQGEATVENFQTGADCLATVRCLRALGVRIESPAPGALRVQGAGRSGLREAAAVLNAANSGTTLRLLAGLLAAQPFFSVLTGDASLRSRPMERIVEPVAGHGSAHPGTRRRHPPTPRDRGRPPAGHPPPPAGRQRAGEVGPNPRRPLRRRRDGAGGAGPLARPHRTHAAGHGSGDCRRRRRPAGLAADGRADPPEPARAGRHQRRRLLDGGRRRPSRRRASPHRRGRQPQP